MTESTTIQKIRTAVVEVEQSGQKSLDIQALLNFLVSVESDLPLDIEMMKLNHASKLAHHKATHEAELAQYKAQVDGRADMFRSVIETAKTALTTSILVNGGATIALLALIGNLLAKATPGQTLVTPAFVGGLVLFATGVLLGAVSTGTTYCSQYSYARKYNRSAATFHVITVVLVVSSYLAFASGVISVFHAFTK